MAAETNLKKMLASMKPHLNEGTFVFCSFPHMRPDLREYAIGTFREKEGFTYIISQTLADKENIAYDFLASWISLEIHSALDAVGLTAAFSEALSKANISCNVVAAYYHDHIFVGVKDASKAMEVLENLSEDASKYEL